MIFLLALCFFIPSQVVQALSFPDLDQSETSCNDLGHCRSIWDIIWGCLATITACTWLCIHPNIPIEEEGRAWRFLRRFFIFVLALLAPELMILWALQQRLTAGRLAEKYKDYQWTLTHGFFAAMGGFMLYKDNKPTHTLDPHNLDDFLNAGQIDITEGEIQDRSKGDALTKGIILIQTSWFVVQLLARAIQHLPITELEIITFAFAVLNFIIYGLWWNKPLEVEFPVAVAKTVVSRQVRVQDGAILENVEPESSTDAHSPRDPEAGKEISRVIVTPKKIHPFRPPKYSLFYQAFSVTEEDAELSDLIFWPFILVFLFMLVVGKHKLRKGEKRVPTFYHGNSDEHAGKTAFYVTLVIAVVFGAIHCLAWSFHFPTSAEQMVWRVSSVVTISSPILASLSVAMTRGPIELIFPAFMVDVMDNIMSLMAVLFLILYALGRMTLLVEAFVSLRSLPPDAYATVHWTTFIPHI